MQHRPRPLVPSRVPPFSRLLKSRDVEDPVNVWLHRPLAYGFVWATWRLPLTPNMVTFLAMSLGLASGALILDGSPAALVAAGLLLWASAILDGADGLLARAKGLSSQFGRALDGAADGVVAAATVFPALWHLWATTGDPLYLAAAGPIVWLAVQHMILYDFYKESYLRETRLERGGEGEDAAAVEARAATLDPATTSWLQRFTLRHVLLPYVRQGERLVRWTNPEAARSAAGVGPKRARSEHTAAVYRRFNKGPMQLWAMISLAPHSYLMALCLMFDRVDLYFWFRLVGANALLLVALVWQRIATLETRLALSPEAAAPREPERLSPAPRWLPGAERAPKTAHASR
ncbi:MAG: CDP-alcohol phosphatidyltransferase family protein [Deltaproteobacteria bacterium]|nr:CDP-alcohol phosphatidyltransferase family protein [Deltaproteobacteria bacterium]